MPGSQTQISKQTSENNTNEPSRPVLERQNLRGTVNVLELGGVLKQIKNGKAAGIDGIYPDMLTHLGPCAKTWLATAFSEIIKKKRNLPAAWTHAKIIALLKPGKAADNPENY